MHRTGLIKLLESYNPLYEEEITTKKEIVTFIQANPHCFERSLESGHITASAWLLNKDRTHALLMHHTKLGIWCQLGGHCDGESDVLNVAIKEAQEESGIKGITPIQETIFDVDIHLIPETKKEKAHYHYDVRFLLNVTSNELIQQNHESRALQWFSKDDTLPTQERSVLRMFEKWTRYF